MSATGWVGKPLETIASEVDADLRAILGDSAGTESDGSIPTASMAGQLKALVVDPIAAAWDLGEAIYSSFDPGKAVGASQDAVNSIRGSQRQAAQNSIATGTCVGDAGTVLLAGRLAGVTGTGAQFSSVGNATLATASGYAASGTVPVGAFAMVSQRVYRSTVAGIGTASGPSGVGLAIADGTATWRYLGEGAALAHVPFAASDAGPVGALANRLSLIVTPVSGWNSINNMSDQALGRKRETDASFRARSEAELAAPGNTTRDTIRANILKVNEDSIDPAHEPADACEVFVNDSEFADQNGQPAKSVEVMVQGGTTADIAQAVFDSIPAGMQAIGNRTDTVYDSEDNLQSIAWTRPTEVQIWVTAVGRYEAREWPSGSDTLVANAMLSALLTYTADWPISRDVRISPLIGAMMRGPAETDDSGTAVVPAADGSAPVAGLLEVETLYIGSASGPTGSAQVSVSARQIAVFDSSRCSITATTEDA